MEVLRMACVKLGSKADIFRREGQTWICTSGLPSDVTIEIGEVSFHLHKFPLLSRSSFLERFIGDALGEGQGACIIHIDEIPGGSKGFELAARFCYGIKTDMTPANIAYFRCAAEYLGMTEDYGEGNLIAQSENFLNELVLPSWNDTIKTLQCCTDVLPHAENANIVKRCIESLTAKACTDPNLFGWPMTGRGPMQSPGGSVLWNGISTGAKPRHYSYDWWYEDVSTLSFPLYKRLISTMESRGIRQEIIVGSLVFYAKRYLPGLNRRHMSGEHGMHRTPLTSRPMAPSEEEQRLLLEEVDRLLPVEKGVASTGFLFRLLRTAMILRVSPSCISHLEKRTGLQLDRATLDDLLLPNYSHSIETLYDVDCVQRILEHFLAMDQEPGEASPHSHHDVKSIGSPSLLPLTAVARLIDGFLAEVAPDVNLKMAKFQALAGTLPDYARPFDDGLYRAIDIYLKAHSWLTDSEREKLCKLMDCQKLSLEACTHAAQNERLPIRVIIQVLFFEQLQLRSSIAGCLLVSDNLDGSRPLRSGFMGSEAVVDQWATTTSENQVLKIGMDSMRMRVAELEKECTTIRMEIERLGQAKGGCSDVQNRFKFKMKPEICSVQEKPVAELKNMAEQKAFSTTIEKLQAKLSKHKRSNSLRP